MAAKNKPGIINDLILYKPTTTHNLDLVYPQITIFNNKFVDKLLFLAIITLYYSQPDLLKDPPCG
jgi:hypothetical protein